MASSTAAKCRRHPRQRVVGICASCLKERLLALMMEEEEDLEICNGRDSCDIYSPSQLQDSPASLYMDIPKHVSSSHPTFNIFTDNCKASTPSRASRRLGVEYDKDDVRHVASLYLQRHHSLAASPLQKQALKLPSPLLVSNKDQRRREGREVEGTPRRANIVTRDETTADGGDCEIAVASTPRKKKGYLWSLLHRHGRKVSISSDTRKESYKVEFHRRSLQDVARQTPTYTPGQYSDGHHKLQQYESSMKGTLIDEVLSGKEFAPSLLSPPASSFQSRLASHGGTNASSRLLSPASSRQGTPFSPLRFIDGDRAGNRHGDEISSRRDVSSEDPSMLYLPDDDDDVKSLRSFHNSEQIHGSKSWISYLFPRKGKYANRVSMDSAGIDCNRAYATQMSSRRQSVSASPKSLTPWRQSISASPKLITPRRKSVSFLDDHLAARTPRSSNMLELPNAPQSEPQKHAMAIPRHGALHPKSSPALRERNLNLAVVEQDQHGYGDADIDAARNANYRLRIMNEAEQLMKSPRMRISNLLPKRSSMGVDCTRDMKVSPAPISLKEISKQSQHLYSDRGNGGDGLNLNVVGVQNPVYVRGRRSSTHGNPGYENTTMGAKGSHSGISLVRSSYTRDARSPLKLRRSASSSNNTLAELEDVDAIQAQYMELYKEKDEEFGKISGAVGKQAKSWSSVAWNKTLSPMLGLRGKKKKKKKQNKESFPNLHDQTNYSRNCSDNVIMNCNLEYDNAINANSAIPGHHHYGINYAINGQESDCQSSLSCRLNAREELLNAARKERIKALNQLSPEAVFTPEHRMPPQHYSFLSKDYSAFSFYFSPARSSTCSNASNVSNGSNVSSISSNNNNNSINGSNYNNNKQMMMMMSMDDQRRRSASVSSGTAINGAADNHYHYHHHHQLQQEHAMQSNDCINGAFLSPPRHSVDGASWTSYPSLFKQALHPSNGR